MTKMYKKTKCEFVENRIMNKNNLVAIPWNVFRLLDELEDNLQRARHLMAQPQAVVAPSMDGYVREHVCGLPMLEKPATPMHDMEVAKTMALLDEIDSMNVVEKVNGTMVNLSPLVEWCDNKWVADVEDGCTDKFDLKLLGNPLEIAGVDILRYIMEIESADRWASGIGGEVNLEEE